MPAQNTKPADYPQAVLQQITLLAQHIVIARKRRKETQAQWAQRIGVSQPTMARIERGDPSVAMASYVMCMWLVNQAQGLGDLIAPQSDMASLEREVARARNRSVPGARASKPKGKSPKDAPDTTRPIASPVEEKARASYDIQSAHAAREVEEAFGAIDRNDYLKKATRMAAGLTQVEELKKAIGMLPTEELKKAMGLLPTQELKKSMEMAAGLGLAEHHTNSTATGLASLLLGNKKARP